MEIGKVIKNARMNKKITQEQLAEALGVTTQAVSKWETNCSYPDITLIPSIANYLNVSSDELLGIKLEERKRNIDEIIKKNNELISQRYLDESLQLMTESLKKYPNDERLLNELTKCYWARMMMTYDKPELFDYRQQLKKLIIENAEKTLEVARNPEIIEDATIYLIQTYPRLGEEGRLKALEIVNTLPGIDYSKELRLTNVLSGNDRKRRLQENVILLLRLINKNFSFRLVEFYDDIEEKIEIFKKNIDLIKLIIGNNLYWFNIPCSNFAFEIAVYYAQLKDKENTLKWLNESANYAHAVIDSPENGEYDSYWIKGVKYSITKIKNYEGQSDVFENKYFDFIRDLEEFSEVKKRYLSAYGKKNY
ncbi:MAG: helix-turn-helix transcriptional regulator [Bacilli bacterium]|nr:helix-turn-helix transcriptional regulator [Bacilli bacterium]